MTTHKQNLRPYADWLRSRNLSDKTIRARVSFLARVLSDLPEQPSDSDLLSLIAPYDGWTKRTCHNHLSSYLDWMVKTGARDTNPLRDPDYKAPSSPSPMPHPLRRHEEAAVLSAADGDLYTWLLLALRQGLRVHEIAKLCGEDVTPEWTYVSGKGGKFERLPTSPEVWTIAASYPRRGWWFPGRDGGHVSTATIERRVRELFRPLGIEGNIHRCRAAFGTTLLRNGATIETVRRLMRHSSLATTQHYLDAEGDELRAAIIGLGGVA